ncbi:heme oxygenase-like protein [Crepidotus variabilis]|uniref:Heme oxygenase-like protein n=1 Tax=Crepidotus variabilis TaxID=179855 RepID=A0A9P6EJI8_9AGAR|nr:heme oxygenase-like protein [Crepidotus variabilis]
MALTLTEHLSSTSAQNKLYIEATQHEFLTLAGQGKLPLDRLALRLSQDRIYAAHAYPRFIGALITRIPFKETDEICGDVEKKNQEILKALTSCLTNIVQEVDFFKQTANMFGMYMDAWEERKEGLVFLWAMEKVYFDAWTYVRKALQTCDAKSESSPAVKKFATNWSSPEFDSFVGSLADMINDIKPGTAEWTRGEAVWQRVLELEVTFWPESGEEISMRKRS